MECVADVIELVVPRSTNVYILDLITSNEDRDDTLSLTELLSENDGLGDVFESVSDSLDMDLDRVGDDSDRDVFLFSRKLVSVGTSKSILLSEGLTVHDPSVSTT